MIALPQYFRYITFLIALIILSVQPIEAKTTVVPKPSSGLNIQPSLQAAVDTAVSGDTIVLPAGAYYLDSQINIRNKFVSLNGQGSGVGGTQLYRRDAVTDSSLAGIAMIEYRCLSTTPSGIVIDGISFKGKPPSHMPGDGLSSSQDYGVRLYECVDFVIAHNRFENFGNAAVHVVNRPELARGVIAFNQFENNWKLVPLTTLARGITNGYGVSIDGKGYSANLLTWVADPGFGSNNFIFIEDNVFNSHRHSVSAGDVGKYVFRHNQVHNSLLQQVDAHGDGSAQGWTKAATRAYEVYDNTLSSSTWVDETLHGDVPIPVSYQRTTNPCQNLPDYGMKFRGGDGVVYNNRIEGVGTGIVITSDSTGTTYPIPGQIGDHNGDLYIWNNTFVPYRTNTCFKPFSNQYSSFIQENRDYWLTAKPNYKPYAYPHPLLTQLNLGSVSPMPSPASPLATVRPTAVPTSRPLSSPALCAEDIDGNRIVGVGDLIQLLGSWGTYTVHDLNHLLSKWGHVCEP